MPFLKSIFHRAAAASALAAVLATVMPGAQAQTPASTTLALPATAIIFAPIYIAADADLWK
jgi:uncharacterized MAPEG superfamily protein